MKKVIKVLYGIEQGNGFGDMLYETLNEAKQIRNKYYKGSNIYKLVDYIDTNNPYDIKNEEILLKA